MRAKNALARCVLTVLFVGCCTVVQGQEALKKRVSVSYQGAPIATVLQALATVVSAQLQLDPTVSGSVTVELRNVSAETVLRAVCESVGCRWRFERGRLIVEPDGATGSKSQPDPYAGIKVADIHQEIPAHIVWSGARLDAVASTLARMLDAQLILDPSLAGKRVALDQDRGSVWSAVVGICREGCRWRFEADPTRRLLLMTDSPTAFDASLPADVHRPGQPGVIPPKLLSQPRPHYTAAVRKAGVTGTVQIECVVLPDGTVGQMHIRKSVASNHELEMEALLAAKLSVFSPGTLNGRPVPVVVLLGFAYGVYGVR